jgi:signal peptidase I
MNNKVYEYSYALKKEKQKKVFLVFLYVILFFIFANLVLHFFLFPVRQVSASMIPDIPENSFVMVSPIVNKVERGDVVLLKSKTNQNNSKGIAFLDTICRFFTAQQISFLDDLDFPNKNNQLRRVIGMPGDVIYMRDYVLYVKPAGEKHFLTEFEVIDKKYNATFFATPAGWDSSLAVTGSFEEIKLGNDEYFVLGDNRKSCSDSRLWGCISKNDIKAKALFCYFPFNKMKVY